MGAKYSKDITQANLTQGIARLNIHKNRTLQKIEENKNTICKHLQFGKEENSLIAIETLLNDERQVPVYDIFITMML